jgi:ABC-type methionine transport system ATPase subunit
MASIKVHLTFPEELIKEPIIYNLVIKYNVITNIRRANVDIKFGWVDLELSGTEENLEKSIEYLKSIGIQVDPIEKDIVES